MRALILARFAMFGMALLCAAPAAWAQGAASWGGDATNNVCNGDLSGGSFVTGLIPCAGGGGSVRMQASVQAGGILHAGVFWSAAGSGYGNATMVVSWADMVSSYCISLICSGTTVSYAVSYAVVLSASVDRLEPGCSGECSDSAGANATFFANGHSLEYYVQASTDGPVSDVLNVASVIHVLEDWAPTLSFHYGVNAYGGATGVYGAHAEFDADALNTMYLASFGILDALGNDVTSSYDIQWQHGTLVGGGIAPIPEPETYAMLLAGLGVLGFAVRRRQRRQSAAAGK